jgi:arylsulfatase
LAVTGISEEIGVAKAAKKAPAKKSSTKVAKVAPATTKAAPAEPHLARQHLPIPDPKHVGLTTYDAKDPNNKYPPIRELRPPKGAPNFLIVLIDDVGFGASSTFGGPCNTPVAERLTAGGLKLNRFHTTALFAYPAGLVDRAQPPLGG